MLIFVQVILSFFFLFFFLLFSHFPFSLAHWLRMASSWLTFSTDSQCVFVGVGIHKNVGKLLCDYDEANPVERRELGQEELRSTGLKMPTNDEVGHMEADGEAEASLQVQYAYLDSHGSQHKAQSLKNLRRLLKQSRSTV